MLIDLHAHSTASDGTDTPAELIERAAAAGLDVVAITDHDTTAGWTEAFETRDRLDRRLTVVPGTEFSCVHVDASGRRVNLHLLGYLFDPEHPALRAEREGQRAARLSRAATIVQRMVDDGVPITWEQVAEYAGGGPVGRPHIGRALTAAGVVADVNAAFAGPLSHTSPYYLGKPNTDVLRMIDLVRDAGGVSVFAHPLAHRRGPIVDDDAIAEMARHGLVGIEADHPDHDGPARAQARALAADLALVVTGSSDYHGTNKTRNELGVCTTAAEAYEALFDRPTARRPVS